MKTMLQAIIVANIIYTGYAVSQMQSGLLTAKNEKIWNRGDRGDMAYIEIRATPANRGKTEIVQYSPVDFIGKREWKSMKITNDNGIARIAMQVGEPFFLYINDFFGQKNHISWIILPGDDITISSNEHGLKFSGTGGARLELQYRMDSVRATIPGPANPRDYLTTGYEDFYEWNKYLDKQLELVIPVIDAYRDKMPDSIYQLIKARFIDQNIDNRSDKFASFLTYARKQNLGSNAICAVYDSTYKRATEQWFDYTSRYVYGSWSPVTYKIFRTHAFDKTKEPLSSELQLKLLLLEKLSQVYKGVLREKCMLDFFSEEFMMELGFIPETEKILAAYYNEASFPEYKKYMRKIELSSRERLNRYNAPDFTLTDIQGKPFTKQDVRGKIAVLDFWFTGCVGCVEMTTAMSAVQKKFSGDDRVAFLNISVDEDQKQWKNSVARKKYTSGEGIQLYTGGQGAAHDIIRQYAVDGYPALWILDQQGRIIRTYPHPDPRKDNGAALIGLIQKYLAYPKDGPYVLYNGSGPTVYQFDNGSFSSTKLSSEKKKKFKVRTDLDTTFTVTLKPALVTEPSVYPRAEKIMVLSDIEGNFDSFRKLLLANGVIDSNHHWTFGDGHLVFAGDMFDRGMQVTECLWLLYHLESEAKEAGGYVHFVLGNHELMNLQGDHRYAVEKYKSNAQLAGTTIAGLYGENSELGRWLRTKNIIEKIGDLLFLHGGISPAVDSLQLTVEEMNRLVRPYYATNGDLPGGRLSVLYRSGTSPFWFRGYYGDIDNISEKPSAQQLNNTLKHFGVRHIITGHTIVADTISVHYGGKVINTDTRHAAGKSEALYIDGGNFYRVNTQGEKKLLFSEVPWVADKASSLPGEVK